MADSGLGSTNIRTVFRQAQGRGLIPKKDKLKGTGLSKAYATQKAGKAWQRLSGQPFEFKTPDEPPEIQDAGSETDNKDKLSKKSGVQGGGTGSSEAISEIATSIKTMKIELLNKMGDMDSRLSKVEQPKTDDAKTDVVEKKPKTVAVPLIPPPSEHRSDENKDANKTDEEEDDEDEVPEGYTKVSIPGADGKEYIEILPTPALKSIQNKLQNVRRAQADVATLGMSDEPYLRELEVKGQGTRRIILSNPYVFA